MLLCCSFLIDVGPTAQGGLEGKRDGLEDLDFYMGNDALNHSTTHQISYPIRHGLIEVPMYNSTWVFCTTCNRAGLRLTADSGCSAKFLGVVCLPSDV